MWTPPSSEATTLDASHIERGASPAVDQPPEYEIKKRVMWLTALEVERAGLVATADTQEVFQRLNECFVQVYKVFMSLRDAVPQELPPPSKREWHYEITEIQAARGAL